MEKVNFLIRCNILPRSAVINWLTVVKLKEDLKYRGHVYFEPVRPHNVYQALTYLKSYDQFSVDIFITNGLSNENTFKFSNIIKIQGQSESVTENKISGGKEMTKNVNYRVCFSWRLPKNAKDCSNWDNSCFWDSKYN